MKKIILAFIFRPVTHIEKERRINYKVEDAGDDD